MLIPLDLNFVSSCIGEIIRGISPELVKDLYCHMGNTSGKQDMTRKF